MNYISIVFKFVCNNFAFTLILVCWSVIALSFAIGQTNTDNGTIEFAKGAAQPLGTMDELTDICRLLVAVHEGKETELK